MRACAWDTASRLCVRAVFCSFAFLLFPPLPSTDSAAGLPTLFVCFSGTISRSDFSLPYITGFGQWPSRCDPPTTTGGVGDLPVPVQKMYVHARVSDDVGANKHSHYRACSYCLLPFREHRPPRLIFRRSMAGLYAPLSTLHVWPHDHPRMTRGQCRSLLFHCKGLSPLDLLPVSRRTEDLHQIITLFIQSKQPQKKQGLMTKLRQIQIDAPEDFAANLDLYPSGEKQASTNLS